MTGYGALATMMASHRNIEAFRKFSVLNIENLLHMQAELQNLEMVINEVRKLPEVNGFDRIWIECPEKITQEDIRGIFERSRTLLDQYRRTRASYPAPDLEKLTVGQIERYCKRQRSMRCKVPAKTT